VRVWARLFFFGQGEGVCMTYCRLDYRDSLDFLRRLKSERGACQLKLNRQMKVVSTTE
jgi:hypothetical protein